MEDELEVGNIFAADKSQPQPFLKIRLRRFRKVVMNLNLLLFSLTMTLLLGACHDAASLSPQEQYAQAVVYAEAGDEERAEKLARLAVQGGHLDAHVLLGNIMFLKKDEEEAMRLWQGAADGGNAEAQRALGFHLYVEDRYEEAFVWTRRAAEQGNPAAQYLMYLHYREGHGVPYDFDQAMHWLRRSAAQSYDSAVKSLRGMEHQGLL